MLAHRIEQVKNGDPVTVLRLFDFIHDHTPFFRILGSTLM